MLDITINNMADEEKCNNSANTSHFQKLSYWSESCCLAKQIFTVYKK